ncbi:hypothetical protein LguiB_029665 [Lonicera macranthoides]
MKESSSESESAMFNMNVKMHKILVRKKWDFTGGTAQSRMINPNTSQVSPISNGIVENVDEVQRLLSDVKSSNVTSDTCEDTYGILPCSDTVIGNIFLIIGYGYLMSFAAKYLSNGSEGLLEILGPGIVGGLILPGLTALPDATIVLGNKKHRHLTAYIA